MSCFWHRSLATTLGDEWGRSSSLSIVGEGPKVGVIYSSGCQELGLVRYPFIGLLVPTSNTAAERILFEHMGPNDLTQP